MESNALNVIKLVLLSIIAVALIFIIVLLMNNKFDFKFKAGSAKLIYENNFTEEVKTIKVESTSTDIRVIENDTNEINVKIYDEKEQKDNVSVEVVGDTLEIVDKKEKISHFFSIGFIGNNAPRIIISVPKDKKYDLDFNTKSGDIEVEKDMNNVTINVTSGDIDLKNALKTKIKTTSGDTSVGEVTDFSLHTTSGDVKARKVNKEVNIEITSGDVTINEVNLSKDSSIKTTSGDVTIEKANDIYVDAHATSGDIEISDNNRKATSELKIKTTSGDIIVNK